MKICRFDTDRLGVVIGDNVHDVTDIQTRVRANAPYDMRGDAVVAALPQIRGELEEAAKKAPGKPLSQVKLLPPVARWSKTMAAPTNYRDHIAEMEAARETLVRETYVMQKLSRLVSQRLKAVREVHPAYATWKSTGYKTAPTSSSRSEKKPQHGPE